MTEANTLVQTIQGDLQAIEEQIRQHAYFHALEAGELPLTHLRYFVGEQGYIIPSDVRSIALLVSRCEDGASQQFFGAVLQGESAAFEAFEPLASAVGMNREACATYEPTPGAQAYSAYLAWLCLYGSDAEVAAALSVNFAAWGTSCDRMAQVLGQRFGLPEEPLRFLTQFAAAPPDVSPQALAIIASGLQRGITAQRIARAARMLQGYELMFWDTIYTLSTAERH